MDSYIVKFSGQELEFKSTSMKTAETAAKAIVSLVNPDKHVKYFVTNKAGETRCGTIHARYI